MNIVKCPNPSCTFQFDATLVPPGAVIACPHCQLQFQLPQVAAAPPTTAPTPEILDADPPGGGRRRGPNENGDGGRGRRRSDDAPPPKRGGNTAALLVVLAVGVGLICCGGVAGVLVLMGALDPHPSDTSPYTYPDYGLTYRGPGEGWQQDKDTQTLLEFRLAAFKHTSPEGYIAVQVMKTDGGAAKGDLLPTVVAELQAHFDDLDEQIERQDAQLLGLEAERYEFTGVYKPTDAGCRGEVYAAAVGNLKVWVYFWTLRDHFDALAPTFAEFRDGMRLDKSSQPKVVRQPRLFRTNAGLYTLTDEEDIWRKQEDPTRQDADADLWLTGFRRDASTGRLDSKPDADLVVAVIDPKGDAKAQAKDHILAQFADGADVNEQAGDPVGESPASGPVAASGEVVRMTMKYPGTTGDANKMMVFKVIDTGGKRVVAYAWCQFRDASRWEQRLMLLVGTLKALK